MVQAAGKTFAGQLDILKNQFDEVKREYRKGYSRCHNSADVKVSRVLWLPDQFQAWLARVNQSG